TGESERAHLLPRDRLSRLGFEPVEDRDRVLHQASKVALASELADETRSMPRAPMGELRLFDEQHVLRPITRQMIGKRRPDRPAADDEDMDVAIGAEGHEDSPNRSPFFPLLPIPDWEKVPEGRMRAAKRSGAVVPLAPPSRRRAP